jgi:hypothetical protein
LPDENHSEDAAERHIGPEELRAEVLQSVEEDERQAPQSVPHSAMVSLNIAPEAIPFESSDKGQLVEVIRSQFRSRYEPPPIPNELGANITVDALMKTQRDNDQLVTFVGGRLKLPGSERVTPIHNLGFGQQTLLATVNGVTAEAEYLCKQLCLLLWDSADTSRRWDEFEDLVELTSYRTSTIVDLGFPLLDLLSEEVKEFLAEDITGKDGIAQYMGFGSSLDRSDLRFLAHCRELELEVTVFDEVSGKAEDCRMEFLPHTRTEANRFRAKIASELDSGRHNDMVAALVRKVGGK